MNGQPRTPRSRRLRLVGGLLIAAIVLVAPACSKKYRAERDGKDVGQAVCDVRDADSAEDAQKALDKLYDQIDDVRDNYAVFTAEDRADVRENVSDLQEHVAQGNDALAQQDLTVIRRSMAHIREDLGESGQAAVDGFFEGLDECLDA